jgi:hypothetical protein
MSPTIHLATHLRTDASTSDGRKEKKMRCDSVRPSQTNDFPPMIPPVGGPLYVVEFTFNIVSGSATPFCLALAPLFFGFQCIFWGKT